MRIPKEFKLLGHTIKVVKNNDLMIGRAALGQANLDAHILMLATKMSDTSGSSNVSKSLLEQTFLHELTHFILHHLNYDELNKDEQFVDNFSGMLHQALTTMKYE